MLAAAGGNLVIPKPVEFLRLTRELTSRHLRTIGKNPAPRGRILGTVLPSCRTNPCALRLVLTNDIGTLRP